MIALTDSDIISCNGVENPFVTKIFSHKGFLAEKLIHNRKEFLFILEQNYEDLSRMIEICVQDPFLLSFDFKGETEEEKYIQRTTACRILLINVNRLLFNFISSAYAVIEFDSKKNDFSKKPIFSFFFGLRNHFLHGNIIDFSYNYHQILGKTGSETIENGFFFDLEKIQKYQNRWQSYNEKAGLKFIEQNLPKIDLQIACKKYFEEIALMHKKITDSIYNDNKKEIDELNEIRLKYNLKI
jgi:hypothetical protein